MQKSWVVRKEILTDKGIEYLPEVKLSDFNIILENNMLTLLGYFSSMPGKIYVFDAIFDDDEYAINKANIHIRQMGSLAPNFHLCMEEVDIPDNWKDVLKPLTILPPDEADRIISSI